jgi:hypothetical protein
MGHGGHHWKISTRRTFLCIGSFSALVTLFGLMQVCSVEQWSITRKVVSGCGGTMLLFKKNEIYVTINFLSVYDHCDDSGMKQECLLGCDVLKLWIAAVGYWKLIYFGFYVYLFLEIFTRVRAQAALEKFMCVDVFNTVFLADYTKKCSHITRT